jgi:class 3 adenylate cyclase/tetratricopeptide (TPR) repeat protein
LNCPRCKSQNPETAAFCDECGTPLETACSSCGEANRREAKFCKKCGHSLSRPVIATQSSAANASSRQPAIPKYLAEKILAERHTLEGERKQVTILFADIKDSTRLVEGLDPEDAQKILDPILKAMMDAVHRYEGTVNHILGDGIMALFGAPLAHEDHAVRACYAALAMQQQLRQHTAGNNSSDDLPQIRIGLNSGEVVVRTIDNDLNFDYLAVGDSIHLAARMQELASPGAVFMTGRTLREVEGFVQVNSLGLLQAKGFAQPIESFELIGVTAVRKRLHAAVARGLSSFVGRNTEIDIFTRILQQASSGHGQILALCGEPGMGKSRLVYEFTHSHLPPEWTMLEGTSASYGKATPYYPLIALLRRYFKVDEGESRESVQTKVQTHLLGLDAKLKDAIPPLLALLDSLPDGESQEKTDTSSNKKDREIFELIKRFDFLEPQQRRRLTLESLKRMLIRESLKGPVLLLLEDLHWIDSETQAFLDHLVESLPMTRLLLLVNHRPGYSHSWSDKSYYTQIRVDPLPDKGSEELLRFLLGDNKDLDPLKKLLIKRADGNPFFMEESVRSLVETGFLLGIKGQYRPGLKIDGIRIPSTVQTVLADRIDRLPTTEKHLLQMASAIGVIVPIALLHGISGLPEEELYRHLATLRSSEFLYESNLFPDLEYTFKHALTNEVVYGAMLHDHKSLLHARIVNALEETVGENSHDHIEKLAHHAFRGELWEKAVVYSWQSGEKASQRSANQEGLEFFETGLRALEHLPQTRANLQQAVDLRLELRTPLYFLSEFDQLHRCLREAESIAERIADDRRLGRVINFLNSYYGLMGEHHRSIEFGMRGLQINRDDVELNTVTHYYMGLASHHIGQFDQSIASLRRALSVTEEERFKYERFGTAFVLSVICRIWLAQCSAQLGRFNEGKTLAEEAMTIAKEADHASSLAFAHISLGFIHLVQGSVDLAISTLEKCQKICAANNIQVLIPHIGSNLAYAYALAGRVDDAIPLMETADEQSKLIGRKAAWSLRLTWLGHASLLGRQIGKAREQAQRAVCLASDAGERGYEAWARKLLGDVIQEESSNPSEALNHYLASMALANELAMRPLQAHIHLSLGRLYHRENQIEKARTELALGLTSYRSMEMPLWIAVAEQELGTLMH